MTFTVTETTQLQSILFRIGDHGIGSLREHKGARKSYSPELWTFEFVVPRPPEPPPPDPDSTLAEIETWRAAHPGRPIVGPDWQPLDPEGVEAFVRLRAKDCQDATIEETWLEGGMALWLR